MRAVSRRVRKIVRWSMILIVGAGLGGFLFAWSGIYNVAASSGHWAIVDLLLRFGMRNSVALRAATIEVPPLGSQDQIALGAAHFNRACVFCHGSPDNRGTRVADAMLPPPPQLSTPTHPWKDEELFWIVRHGIKYTGMPGWLALERADEVWAIVAFLRKLPSLDAAQYRALALGPEGKGPPQRLPADRPELVSSCASCHGDRDTPPQSALVPRLHGQSEAFLASALRNYARGARPSGIMQPIAAELDGRDISRLAKYYAELSPISGQPTTMNNTDAARGQELATHGDAAARVPACVSCHRPEALDTFPSLDGQSAAYMAAQLRLWKAGHNSTTDSGAIMAPIARRLSERDIDAVSQYFANRPAKASTVTKP